MNVEWLILADAAEVVGGKLYMMGGGWSRIYAQSEEAFERRIAVALSLTVPFNETFEPQSLEVEFVDGDGHSLANKIQGSFEVAPTIGTPRQMNQRMMIAVNVNLPIPGPGIYEAIARVPGAEEERVPFHVMLKSPMVSQPS